MKKSHIVMLLTFLLLIPATIYFGLRFSGRAYYVTSTLVMIETLVPFLLAFENRKPQARELVVIAVLSALAVAARVVIPIPNFKAIFAIIMLSGIAFGPETGFLVGAISAFASNFFYGQGPYTPWQMFAYGAGGLLAGFLFAKGRLPRKPVVMGVFGFLTTLLLVGPLLDTCSVFLELSVNQCADGVAPLCVRLLGEPQSGRVHVPDHGDFRESFAGKAGSGEGAVRDDGGRRWALKAAIRR